MSWLRTFVLALLVAPGHAGCFRHWQRRLCHRKRQPWKMSIQALTTPDAIVICRPNFANSRCTTGPNSHRARSSSTPPTTTSSLIIGNGVALRYGVGVGRDGFEWGSVQKITLKREWPDWIPPSEMIARQPYLRAGWRAGRAIRSGLMRSISAPRFIAFTAQIRRRPSARRCRQVASGWSMTMSPIFTRACNWDQGPGATSIVLPKICSKRDGVFGETAARRSFCFHQRDVWRMSGFGA